MKYSSITTVKLPEDMPEVSVELTDLTTSIETSLTSSEAEKDAWAWTLLFDLLADGIPGTM